MNVDLGTYLNLSSSKQQQQHATISREEDAKASLFAWRSLR